jgi:hypothetical protein
MTMQALSTINTLSGWKVSSLTSSESGHFARCIFASPDGCPFTHIFRAQLERVGVRFAGCSSLMFSSWHYKTTGSLTRTIRGLSRGTSGQRCTHISRKEVTQLVTNPICTRPT